MSEHVPISKQLLIDALNALEWKFVQDDEGGLAVRFEAKDKPTVHVNLKVAGPRVLATSAIAAPINRDHWAEVLVDINQYNTTHFRPKMYLNITEETGRALLIGEEVYDAAGGSTTEWLGAWIGGHANAFATGAGTILSLDLS
jgi:hypothetical protein